ncbi:MAG: FkbM family methyltransferase [Gammaproteobacteria bacterium]|nr:FkbM family methyltransferase [Gammaproteobacteria bacterium]
MNALQDVLPPMEVVIDIGANIGIVSCWLSRKSHIVYSFEPEQLNINFLQKNIQLNDIKNIEIVPFAVGAYDGATDFFIRDSFGHHGIKSKHITKVVDIRQVPMVRLDSFCREKLIDRISFLKIDVEGGELDVLQGFDEYLVSKKVDMVLFEHAPVLFNTDEEKAAVFDYLTSRDYLIFDIDHKKLDRSTMLRIQQGDFYAKPV